MKKPTESPIQYPFYTIEKGANDVVNAAKAYLTPYAVVVVQVFDCAPKIEIELPYNTAHYPPKWEATVEQNWKEQLSTEEEFMSYYNRVQEQIKAILISPPVAHRSDLYVAELEKGLADYLSANPPQPS